MEVNFRPIPPSSAIRRSVPGEIPSSDEGEGFLEIIEKLTYPENNPEAGEQAQKKEQATSNASKNEKEKTGFAEESKEEPPPTSVQSSDEQPTSEKKVGGTLDILA